MDKYTKLFGVGDVIRPTEQQQSVFRGYHYEAPFVVIKSYSDSLGRWLLKFGDATGRGLMTLDGISIGSNVYSRVTTPSKLETKMTTFDLHCNSTELKDDDT